MVMRRRNRPFGLSLIGLLAVAIPVARGQSYGSQEQVLTIGAAAFEPMVSASARLLSDGYRYLVGTELYLAPVSLPEGAFVEKACLYAFDNDPGYLEIFLMAVRLVQGGETPDWATFGIDANSFTAGDDFYYDVFCREIQSGHTIRSRIDVDGDGTLDAIAYYVAAWLPAGGGTFYTLGLGGVRMTWRRQTSAAPESPTFGDVPASDPAFPFIEALAASGITAGCAAGNYCPDASLTRRQMAVFLAKALGLHWAD